MRDLGKMGEDIFSFWCNSVGLVINKSQQNDKTGWDYYVEFPFENNLNSPLDMQKPPPECKVQVKSTDKRYKRLSIKLSNLHCLITAQMPALFIFIEFDGFDSARSAYLVHVDEEIIKKVLKRLREIDVYGKFHHPNKRTITIHYDKSHKLDVLNGESLKAAILSHIGNDFEGYVKRKMEFLKSTGFEDGFGQISFTTIGEENLKKLIDVSLGIEREVDVNNVRGTHCRFGISSKPFVISENARVRMVDLKPIAFGSIRFKETRFSPSITFPCKIYNSPFNAKAPKDLVKLRVEGDFFDFMFNPYIGTASLSFFLGEGIRLKICQIKNAIKLMSLLGTSGKKLLLELEFEGYPKLEARNVGTNESSNDWSHKLKCAEDAVFLSSFFEIEDEATISLPELLVYEQPIRELYSVINSEPAQINVEFSVEGKGFTIEKEIACLFFMSTFLGDHIVGIILAVIGYAKSISGERYSLSASRLVIDSKVVSMRNEDINSDDLLEEIERIEVQYKESGLEPIRMFK